MKVRNKKDRQGFGKGFPTKVQDDLNNLNVKARAVDACPHCGKRIIAMFDHNYTVQTITRGFYTPAEVNEEVN